MDKKKQLLELIWQYGADIFQAPESLADKIIVLFEGEKFIPPSKPDLINYILEKELMQNKTIAAVGDISEMFINYYDSVGWVVGKSKKPMVSWRKALNNWCKRDWNNPKTKSIIEESVKAYLQIQSQKQN